MTDKLLTEAIKACFERVSESHGVGDGTLCNAESELAAILKRDEELEAEKQREFDIATGYYNGREKARRRIAEQEAQIAVMRETLLDIALCGDSLPMDATPDEHDAAIISMRDMASAALTPDTGERVVDVAWLKEVLCAVRLHAIATERADLHELADRIAALIGEGEANDE